MPVNVYMIFNGNCEEAAQYYAQVFGLEKPEISRFGDMPPKDGEELPEAMKQRVMHTNLTIHGTDVMFSDSMAQSPVPVGQNIHVAIISDDLERMTEEFNHLAQDGKLIMDMQETFWSQGYGIVEDKYGIAWMFSHDDGRDTPA